MTIVDDRTEHLDLPLPHWDNLLWDDVIRLRKALVVLDAKVRLLDELLASDDVGLDALQELVNAIKENYASIEDILTSKLNVAEFHRLIAPADSASYEYDEGGNVVSATESVGGKPRVSQYFYNDGLVEKVVATYDGKTRTETYTYSNGRVASIAVVEN